MILKTFVFLSTDRTVGIVRAENRQHATNPLDKFGKHFVILWEVKEEPHVKVIGKLR